MTCCGIERTNGVPNSGGGGGGSAATWETAYRGNFAGASVVDLAAGVNPTVTVANAVSGPVASAIWTSNAGDATATVTQGAVTSFGTDGATGLAFVGAVTTSNFINTAQNAPHIWVLWDDLLGADAAPGVDYCFLVRFTATPSSSVAAQACGSGIYSPNDGSPEPNLDGNPATDDEKCFRGWYENISTTFSVVGREESTSYRGINGPLIPASSDVVGFIMYDGGSAIQTVVGTSSGGEFPSVPALTRTFGPYQGGSISFPGRPYGTPLERIAIPFQQQGTGSFSATVAECALLRRFAA